MSRLPGLDSSWRVAWRRVTAFVAGSAVAGAAFSGAAFSGTGLAPSEKSDIEVVAEFTDAGAIIAGNDVKVDGVQAGRVERLEVRDGLARVTLSVDAGFTPLHTDASAAIRPVSLLGERFVDLDRGTPSAPVLDDGGVIPATQTRRSVDFQEILDTVDEPTGTALAALLVALGDGMAGRGGDAAAAADALEPAMTRTAALLEILGEQNELLQALIDRSEPVLGALASGRGQRVDELVAATDRLLGASAAAAPRLDEGLRRLPAALSTARSALAELAALADETTPMLASLRPVTGDLPEIAAELSDFADAAGPALASLDPVLERGNELIEAARPVVAELAAAGGDMETAARSGRAMSDAFPEDLGNVLDFVRNLALATSGSDGISHYLRTFVVSSPEAVDGRFPEGGPAEPPSGEPPAPPEPPVVNRPAPAPAAPVPAPAEPAGRVFDHVRRLLEPAAPPAPPADTGSATGLTVEQERSLLRYLIGGR